MTIAFTTLALVQTVHVFNARSQMESAFTLSFSLLPVAVVEVVKAVRRRLASPAPRAPMT